MMRLNHLLPSLLTAVSLLALVVGCSKPESRVEIGNREQILHLGNKSEPQELDPHIVEGTGEHNILAALLEGLTGEDPKTLEPVPGVAERWEISEYGLVYTFYLRENARWSNGDRVTAQDFFNSYQRILTPSLASRYAYMLYPIKNAREFNEGKLTDFAEVGVKAPEVGRLVITLSHPTPYFLAMTAHHYTYLHARQSVDAAGQLRRQRAVPARGMEGQPDGAGREERHLLGQGHGAAEGNPLPSD